MLLFDVGEEGGVAEVGLSAGALVVPGLDGDDVLVEGILLEHGETIIYKVGY